MLKTIDYKRIKRRKAFTLVEVMVAILMTTIVLTAIYTIWSRVQRGIARSATRQKLQNELRKAANFMQNDFKSIKLEKDTFKISEPNNTNFSMAFEKYKETEDGKLAQDSTEKVTYEKKGNMLVRTADKTNILTMSCDEINIQQSEEKDAGLGDDFEAARKAKLDISISGFMKVPGTGEEMYHVEKTSVVMRDEYNKNTNKTFISTFDLTKKDTTDVFLEDHDADGVLEMGQTLDLEFLKTLSDDVLEGMDESQKDQRDQAIERLDELNEAIKDTDTGESGWSKFWKALGIKDDSAGGKEVRGLRSDLSKVKADVSKNEKNLDTIKNGYEKAIKDVEDIKAKLEKFTKDKETKFLNDSTGGKYSSMSEKEKKIYEKAYEMKLQDRNLEGGYNKQYESASDDEKKDMKKPTLNIDRLQGKDVEDVSVTNKDNTTSSVSSLNTSGTLITEENKAVIEAYNKISLDWMGEFGDEEESIGIYNAAKQLITQADTKIDVLRMEQTCQENIAKIETAMQQN